MAVTGIAISTNPGEHIRIVDGDERRVATSPANSLYPRAAGLHARDTTTPTFRQTECESERFIQIVEHASKVNCHYDLYRLLQNQVQHFIPHQILISAWGDFDNSSLTLDVVSPLPGVRTELLAQCGLEPLIKDYFARFIANERRPLQLNGLAIELANYASCNCAIHTAMKNMQCVQIFGVRNERDDQETLYVALNPEPVTNGQTGEYRAFLIDSVIAQIDVAFRKVAALKISNIADKVQSIRLPDNLSSRERDVLAWLIQGKTNPQIAEALKISSFTVKNHAQRIFKKLKVTNRTEVAAMFRMARA